LHTPKPDPRIAERLPMCRAMARRYLPMMCGQRALEDLISVAQAAVWKATLTHDESREANFRTYSRRCVRNALENERKNVWATPRRTALHQSSLSPANDEDLGIDLASKAPSPFELLSSARDHRAVNEALARIKPNHRAVLEGLFFADNDQVDVAKMTSVSRQAIQQLSVEALRSLARELAESDPETTATMKRARTRKRDR
jgi:RNA polymerase sigma factor (sigma-70 family)